MNVQAPREFIDRRQLVSALRALRRGDFTVRLPEDVDGADGEIASLFNEVVGMNEAITQEFERLARVVGKEGKISQRARVRGASGGWDSKLRAVNELIDDMVQPTAEVSRVIGAVAKGDLSQSMTVEIDGRPLRGEFLRIGKVVNTMVDQLNGFANEVTRVAREVGTEGKLGGQAKVKGVAGTWKDLTDNVNAMATNLTGQVRNIAEVTTAVARGDLSKKITVEVRGEILELKNTINTMVDQLNGFASEVTRVAREVGTEGKLGGQAQVPGVAGTWKDLTDNVNLMAENLTGQVRNIADVTTAVAKGDLIQEDHRRREGRDPRAEEHHQHDGGPAQRVRVGSHPRGARSGHRRQAWRPGARGGRRGYLEGSHRQCEPDGREPHRPGSQHRRSDDRGRPRRPVQEDHCRRARRDPRAEGHHQHDGRPAQLVRVRSYPRGSRSGLGRKARRPGAGGRRRRHLGRLDGQREPDGR